MTGPLTIASDSVSIRIVSVIAAVLCLFAVVSPVAAQASGGEEINWFFVGMQLFGGLALFLFGMDQMSRGLKAAAGEGLKVVLSKLTSNRFLGALTGAFVTAVLNSSSVTTVLVVGFITAGIMSLQQSIGVIMGANVGSTVTAQIIAFNVTQYALAMVAVGFAMMFTGKRENTRHYGEMIMGLGLIFFGMGVMSEAMTPLRSYEPFIDLMAKMERPVLGILVGAVFTGLVQSSAATTGIAIVMAGEGLISLPAGIALAFGSNIGTCATALLAAIGKPTEAVRAAVAHILFNVAGVALWLAFIPSLAEFVMRISPSYPDLEGSARMAAEVPRQIANAHTVFNVANTMLFIWFTGLFARLVVRLVPDRAADEKVIVEVKFLDAAVLVSPALALERVRLEIGHMGEIVKEMLVSLPDAMASEERGRLDAIARMDDKVDILEGEILQYLGEVRKQELTDRESEDFLALVAATDNLESIGDVIETELVALGRLRLDNGLELSETMREMLRGLHGAVVRSVDAAVRAASGDDERAAQEIMIMKDEVHHLVEEALKYQADALTHADTHRLALFRLEMDAVDKLKRIYSLSKRIAKGMLPKVIASTSE